MPSIGIDFGTTNSSMAWFDPRTESAEVIKNAEGEDKTPSLVYFGEGETLVGKPADKLIEDASNDVARREEVFRRTIASIKRDLIAPPRIALPGGRFVRPVEVAAEILKKLKRDAEEGHFHEEVSRAVITCPAEFNALQRQKIEQAGRLAGFGEVVLLEEPVAGALSYARAGLGVGRHVLVYDLGGGTFDLAVLDNEDESFHVAMEPKGIERCGGDDFDQALYYHCDEVAQEQLGRTISLTDKKDLKFLHRCRQRKENFTYRERETFSDYLASDNGPMRFEHEIDRATFEGLINEYVETTVRLTEEILKQADTGGREVDTVVLVGGSSRVLLVKRMLDESLPVKPLGFDKKDVAVALGAAHYTHIRWQTKPKPPPPPPELPTPLDKYREAVETLRGRKIEKVEVDRVNTFAGQLGLSREQAARIERQVLGVSKEHILFQQYRRAVEMVWIDGKLNSLELEWLDTLASESGLDQAAISRAESEVMGASREQIFRPDPRSESSSGIENFDPIFTLTGHSGEVRSVAFSPDGRFLVSGASDHEVRGWDARAGRSVGALAGHSGEVRSVVFSPDGTFLASGGLDKTIRIWKLPNGEPSHSFNHSEWVFSIAISPDNRLLASGGADKEIKLWDLETGQLLRTLTGHSHWVLSVAFAPDSGSLVSGGADNAVKVWNPGTGELVRTYGDSRSKLSNSQSWSSANMGGRRERSQGHTDWVWSVAISSDGQRIVSCSEDGTIKVWNCMPTSETEELLSEIVGHSGPILSVAIGSDERFFSGGSDGSVKVWDPETRGLIGMLPGHSGGVGCVALSADGQLLASGGYDHKINIWRKKATERPKAAGSSGDRARVRYSSRKPPPPPSAPDLGRTSKPPTMPDEPGPSRSSRPQDLPD
jgi:actin-like ATPase involved in cell morphogenesis